jgi:hypothetical protein
MERNKGYNKIVPDCEWEKKGDDNYSSMAKSIATTFQKERKREEEDDNKNQKSLKTLNTLHLEGATFVDVERAFTETKRWLDKRIKYFVDEYRAMLEVSEYEKAAEFYEGAARYQKYKPLLYISDNEKIKDNSEE